MTLPTSITYYLGRVTSKSGRTLDTQLATSREEAARALFARNPTAKRVSTSVCSADGMDWHKDVRWTSRAS